MRIAHEKEGARLARGDPRPARLPGRAGRRDRRDHRRARHAPARAVAATTSWSRTPTGCGASASTGVSVALGLVLAHARRVRGAAGASSWSCSSRRRRRRSRAPSSTSRGPRCGSTSCDRAHLRAGRAVLAHARRARSTCRSPSRWRSGCSTALPEADPEIVLPGDPAARRRLRARARGDPPRRPGGRARRLGRRHHPPPRARGRAAGAARSWRRSATTQRRRRGWSRSSTATTRAPEALSLEDAIVKDADKLWRFTESGVRVAHGWVGRTPGGVHGLRGDADRRPGSSPTPRRRWPARRSSEARSCAY